MKARYLTILVALGLLTTACEKDYLETAPTASIDAGAAYSTTKNAASAINGIYRAMVVRYLGSQGHFGHPAMMIIIDALGEDLLLSNTSNNWHLAEQRWQAHRSETSVGDQLPYELYYRVIGNANIGIASIDNAAGTQPERNQVKGEALALRAFSYFNLVQLYGKRYDAAAKPNSQLGVPLVLTAPPLKDCHGPPLKKYIRR